MLHSSILLKQVKHSRNTFVHTNCNIMGNVECTYCGSSNTRSIGWVWCSKTNLMADKKKCDNCRNHFCLNCGVLTRGSHAHDRDHLEVAGPNASCSSKHLQCCSPH